MGHIQTLIVNEIRKPLEALEEQNVGFIFCESESTIFYKVDDKTFAINVSEQKETD